MVMIGGCLAGLVLLAPPSDLRSLHCCLIPGQFQAIVALHRGVLKKLPYTTRAMPCATCYDDWSSLFRSPIKSQKIYEVYQNHNHDKSILIMTVDSDIVAAVCFLKLL